MAMHIPFHHETLVVSEEDVAEFERYAKRFLGNRDFTREATGPSGQATHYKRVALNAALQGWVISNLADRIALGSDPSWCEEADEPERLFTLNLQILIKPGDTLSGIAHHYEMSMLRILAINPQISNPDRIMAGEDLTVEMNVRVKNAKVILED